MWPNCRYSSQTGPSALINADGCLTVSHWQFPIITKQLQSNTVQLLTYCTFGNFSCLVYTGFPKSSLMQWKRVGLDEDIGLLHIIGLHSWLHQLSYNSHYYFKYFRRRKFKGYCLSSVVWDNLEQFVEHSPCYTEQISFRSCFQHEQTDLTNPDWTEVPLLALM